MPLDAPLTVPPRPVLPEWVDENGHMNVAYYLKCFDESLNVFFEAWGLSFAESIARGYTTFTVQANVGYRSELLAGENFSIELQLVGHDRKRIHLFLRMVKAGGVLAATCEMLMLFVDFNARRATSMPDDYYERLATLQAAHAALPRPVELGRVITIPAARDA